MIPSDVRRDHRHLSPSGRKSKIYTIRVEAVFIRLLHPTLINDAFHVFDLECVDITGAIPQYFLSHSNKLIEFYGGQESLASRRIYYFFLFVVDNVDRPAILVFNHPPFNNFQQERSNLLIAYRQVVNKIYERVFCPCTGTIRRMAVEVGEQILRNKGGV